MVIRARRAPDYHARPFRRADLWIGAGGGSGSGSDGGGCMVTRARFERATPSFGGWCSIQLSYRATGGTYWARTSDLCGVNTALYQLS